MTVMPVASAPAPLLPRIDVHVHLGGIGTSNSGIRVSPRFRRGIVFRVLLRSLGVTRDMLDQADLMYVDELALRVRDSTSIDHAVALAMDGRWRNGEIDWERSPLVIPNDWSRDASRRHPELLFGASVSPMRPDALDELDRVADQGAVLCKWLPNVMGIDPADRAHVPFYKKLADLSLPLLTHCGHEFTLPGGDARVADPERLERALDEGVTVIAAHAGTLCWKHVPGFSMSGIEILARLAERHPRLHVDLAALTTMLRGWQLRTVLDEPRLAGRLLDATDFPVPCLPFTQAGRAPWGAIRAASRLVNPFDRDRALKVAAGMPDEATRKAASILRLPR